MLQDNVLEMEYSIFGAGGPRENANAKGRGVCYANDVPKFLPFMSRGKCAYFSCTNFVTNLCRVTVIKSNELTIRKLRSCCLLFSRHTPNIERNTSSYVAQMETFCTLVGNIERRRSFFSFLIPKLRKSLNERTFTRFGVFPFHTFKLYQLGRTTRITF